MCVPFQKAEKAFPAFFFNGPAPKANGKCCKVEKEIATP